jgi:FtsP/CotA-like multicopper oxidase with cupredoxin domain
MLISRRQLLASVPAIVAVTRISAAQEGAGVAELRAEPASLPVLENGGSVEAMSFTKGEEITVLRARQGDEFRVRIVNLTPDEIWFHWFGVRGPSDMMTVNVPPGEAQAVECVFTPSDAGTFWFGPLIDASRQRDMGLYGMLIVQEREPQTGLVDVPVIIDDWLLQDGAIAGDFGSLESVIAEGRLGNWFTVNGRFRNLLKLPQNAAARLRILNAANIRTMGLQFKGADPLIAALDGQPVPLRHLGQEALRLAPGQRADLILGDAKDLIVLALDLFEDVVEIGYLDPGNGQDAPLLPENFSLPANPLPQPGDFASAKRIQVKLEGGAKGGLKEARLNGALLDLRSLLEKGIAWAVNGQAGPGGAPLAELAAGETVIFDIENATAFEQPLHIHGHVWHMLDGQGGLAADGSWRDTTVIQRGEKQSLVFVAAEGTWALQSLVAERVDSGLLASFIVSTPT